MTAEEIKALPIERKMEIMEAIWEDLRAQAERVPVPQWHRDLLDERRKAVEQGREEGKINMVALETTHLEHKTRASTAALPQKPLTMGGRSVG